MKERGKQLALGQVARRAEDGQDDRVGNSLSALRNLGKILGTYFHLNGCHNLTLRAVISCQFSVVSSQFSAAVISCQFKNDAVHADN